MQSTPMYAPASPFSRPIPAGANALSGMYRQVGLETSVTGASSHHLVTLLFDGFLDALTEARGALLAKDMAAKARALSRAIRIVDEGLKACLNVEAGGELALNLRDLYTYISLRLTQANLRNDHQALDECTQLIQPVREAWLAIKPAASAQAAQGGMEVKA
ncbi:flagellar export chaperone FliS [Aquabacterium sp. A3]|uniref:flagellar export chaperone FliS n=1 Tax=Aquabacterium sp. A3 TaxID=3132829 RepID=UPI003119F2A7